MEKHGLAQPTTTKATQDFTQNNMNAILSYFLSRYRIHTRDTTVPVGVLAYNGERPSLAGTVLTTNLPFDSVCAIYDFEPICANETILS